MSRTSKTKTYWDRSSEVPDPFSISKRISRNLAGSSGRFDTGRDGKPPIIKYLWIYVTEDGLERKRLASASGPGLSDEDWLNIIDESCSLGAEWMIIYVGARLSECPEVWRMCDWAQQEYGMRVGLHLRGECLQAPEIECLLKLDAKLTFIMAEKSDAVELEPLRERGLNVCVANVRKPDRPEFCESPEDIACVGIDGELFTCGLVLGEEAYSFGNVRDLFLKNAMTDQSLPHAVAQTGAHHEHGCDGCPPHVARRALESLPK